MFPARRSIVAALALACCIVPSLAQSVVINEIYYDPPDNTKAIEFVEFIAILGANSSRNSSDFTFDAAIL